MKNKKLLKIYMILLLSFSVGPSCAGGPKVPICFGPINALECVDENGKPTKLDIKENLTCTTTDGMRQILEQCKLKDTSPSEKASQ